MKYVVLIIGLLIASVLFVFGWSSLFQNDIKEFEEALSPTSNIYAVYSYSDGKLKEYVAYNGAEYLFDSGERSSYVWLRNGEIYAHSRSGNTFLTNSGALTYFIKATLKKMDAFSVITRAKNQGQKTISGIPCTYFELNLDNKKYQQTIMPFGGDTQVMNAYVCINEDTGVPVYYKLEMRDPGGLISQHAEAKEVRTVIPQDVLDAIT